MSLTSQLPAAILETILPGLATLFLTGAGGDMAAARHAAIQMLDAYHPRTENELRLAANIVGFSFHALEALAQAAEPGLSLTRVLRLRGSAVSLSRESDRAERRLMQLQKAQPIPDQSPETQLQDIQPTDIQPQDIQPTDIQPQDTPAQHGTTIPAPLQTGSPPPTRTEEDRQSELRIAASIKRAEALVARLANAA
jgi:hypothetical protein